MGEDDLDERLERQVGGLTHARRLDPSAAVRVVAALRASAGPDGVGRLLGPSAGPRYAYRGYDDVVGAALFVDARREGRDLVAIDASQAKPGSIVATMIGRP